VGDGVAAEVGDLVFVVPVESLSLRGGDTIYVQYEGRSGAFRRVNGVVDSWERRFEILGVDGGDTEVVQLPPKVWRVTRRLPTLGFVFQFLVGPTQSTVLMMGGLTLIAFSEVRRNRARRARGVPVDGYRDGVVCRTVVDDTRVSALHG
jgi:hypothetical protein